MDGGVESQVLESISFSNFEVIERGIYFIPAVGGAIQFFSFATGAAKPVVTLNGGVSGGLSVSPDGRSILYALYEPPRSDLMLEENFR